MRQRRKSFEHSQKRHLQLSTSYRDGVQSVGDRNWRLAAYHDMLYQEQKRKGHIVPESERAVLYSYCMGCPVVKDKK